MQSSPVAAGAEVSSLGADVGQPGKQADSLPTTGTWLFSKPPHPRKSCSAKDAPQSTLAQPVPQKAAASTNSAAEAAVPLGLGSLGLKKGNTAAEARKAAAVGTNANVSELAPAETSAGSALSSKPKPWRFQVKHCIRLTLMSCQLHNEQVTSPQPMRHA